MTWPSSSRDTDLVAALLTAIAGLAAWTDLSPQAGALCANAFPASPPSGPLACVRAPVLSTEAISADGVRRSGTVAISLVMPTPGEVADPATAALAAVAGLRDAVSRLALPGVLIRSVSLVAFQATPAGGTTFTAELVLTLFQVQ